MKKISLIFGMLAMATLLVIGGCTVNKKAEKEKLIEIVKSDEAKKVLEERLKQIEPASFTSQGVIQNYKIDYHSVERNPMGGIIVVVYVNGNKNYRVSTFINKDSETGKLVNGGGSNPPLEKLKENQ